ncbi:MAG: hypothetical protein ACT452_01595 [Microthrixaceae bacterium]
MCALAAALALVSVGTLATHAQAGDLPPVDPAVVTSGPVGVLVMGGPDEDPPVGEEPAPPTPDDPTPPSNEPSPSADTASAPVAAAPGASTPRPPGRLGAGVSNPAAGAARNDASASRGEGRSLEDIFLNNRATSARPGPELSHASRSAIPLPSSSLPSMLLATLFGMLGVLLVASRHYGSSFVAASLRTAMPRRSAPRGWRVVATTPPPMPGGAVASISDLERPVLAVKSPAASSR